MAKSYYLADVLYLNMGWNMFSGISSLGCSDFDKNRQSEAGMVVSRYPILGLT